jgi:DNA-binding transcriptional MocR family regulator
MRIGHALSPDDVVIANGRTEALTLSLTAVARPGDTIAVESPTYMGLLHTLEVLGLKAFELPVDPARGINIDALAHLLESEPVAACVLASNFNNPLGSSMAEADKRTLLAVLARHDVPLVEDDVYGDIHFGRERPRPFVALAGGAFDAHLRSVRRLFQDNLAHLARAVEASFPPATKMSRPTGGFVLWLELPRHFDSRKLFDEALEQGICFAPGDVFSASRRFRNCLRLSAGHAWNDRLEDGVRRLGRLARKHLARG